MSMYDYVVFDGEIVLKTPTKEADDLMCGYFGAGAEEADGEIRYDAYGADGYSSLDELDKILCIVEPMTVYGDIEIKDEFGNYTAYRFSNGKWRVSGGVIRYEHWSEVNNEVN